MATTTSPGEVPDNGGGVDETTKAFFGMEDIDIFAEAEKEFIEDIHAGLNPKPPLPSITIDSIYDMVVAEVELQRQRHNYTVPKLWEEATTGCGKVKHLYKFMMLIDEYNGRENVVSDELHPEY